MRKRTIYIIAALAALTVLGGGVGWYIVKPETQTTRRGYREIPPPARDNMAPPKEYLPIPELSEEEWPYDRPAEHLYIQKGITLDPNVVTINNELKDVTLCGTTYKSKQVMIDGVDVVQRVAKLFSEASATTSEKVCPYLLKQPEYAAALGGRIKTGEELRILIHKSDPTDPDYLVSLFITNSLYSSDGGFGTGLETWVGVSKNAIRFGSPTFGPSIDAPLHEQ